MKYLLYIFYLESAITLLSAAQAFFTPPVFLQQFTNDSAPALALEMTRWYGVVLFGLVYLLLRGLSLRGEPLKLALQTLLIGDVLQIVATFYTAQALGGWSTVLIMSVGLSVFYALLRGLCLWKPVETGINL